MGIGGCGKTREAVDLEQHGLQLELDDAKQQIAKLKLELEHEKNKPAEIKYMDKIVVKEVESMTFFKIMGMWIMGLSVGASVILYFIAPVLRYIGYAGLATGGFFYYSALTNQFLTPMMPYILLAVISVLFIGGCVYAYRKIDWSKDEKQGIKDLAEGNSATDSAKKLLNDVLSTKSQSLLRFLKK